MHRRKGQGRKGPGQGTSADEASVLTTGTMWECHSAIRPELGEAGVSGCTPARYQTGVGVSLFST